MMALIVWQLMRVYPNHLPAFYGAPRFVQSRGVMDRVMSTSSISVFHFYGLLSNRTTLWLQVSFFS